MGTRFSGGWSNPPVCGIVIGWLEKWEKAAGRQLM